MKYSGQPSAKVLPGTYDRGFGQKRLPMLGIKHGVARTHGDASVV